jgi:hypothetical protein
MRLIASALVLRQAAATPRPAPATRHDAEKAPTVVMDEAILSVIGKGFYDASPRRRP